MSQTRGFTDARWMTYRQSQEQDAQVRKGEKGTPIQFWKWQGLEPVKDANGKPVLDQDGQPVRQMVRYERPRVMGAVVFNAEQIDGLPPAPARPVRPEWERHAQAETILANSGVPIRHIPGDRAFYRLAEDTITMPERSQFPTGDRYYATALHELGHATGHPSRLARDLAHPFGSEGYAREELRAEIGSLMLGEQLGIGHDPSQHVAYVASWIKALEEDPREVFRAAADAEKIVKLVRSYELGQEQASRQYARRWQPAGGSYANTIRLGSSAADHDPRHQPGGTGTQPRADLSRRALCREGRCQAARREVGSGREGVVRACRHGPGSFHAVDAGQGLRPHRRGRQPGRAVCRARCARAACSSMARHRWTASFTACARRATRGPSAAAPIAATWTAGPPGSSRITGRV